MRYDKVANWRKNRNHLMTATRVRDHTLIVTEELAIANMTATAKGTVEDPRSHIKQKAGLNRVLLDTTPDSIA